MIIVYSHGTYDVWSNTHQEDEYFKKKLMYLGAYRTSGNGNAIDRLIDFKPAEKGHIQSVFGNGWLRTGRNDDAKSRDD